MVKTYVSWEQVHQLIDKIYSQTTQDPTPLGILGISRGGLIPAVLLSQLKENCLVFSVGIKSYTETTRGKDLIYQYPDIEKLTPLKTLYIIDDICDSGLTFKNLVKEFNSVNIKTISLFYRTNSVCKPHIIGQEITNDSWIVFPWEKE